MNNSYPRQKSSRLTALRDRNGNIPANFPVRYGDIGQLTNRVVTNLLEAYGQQPADGGAADRREQFEDYITGLKT